MGGVKERPLDRVPTYLTLVTPITGAPLPWFISSLGKVLKSFGPLPWFISSLGKVLKSFGPIFHTKFKHISYLNKICNLFRFEQI
jgi:hypothetical protein